jgi:hypothetical protein
VFGFLICAVKNSKKRYEARAGGGGEVTGAVG